MPDATIYPNHKVLKLVLVKL